jgi:hypothetical protein
MYSTSSEKTRVIWAAHSNSIGFTDEIGHFQACNGPNPIPATPFGLDASGNPVICPAGNTEDAGPTDADDDFCFPASESSLVQLNGCTDTNTGFDGTSYQAVWGDGNPLHPTPIKFTSPTTGSDYQHQYERAALEADLPRIEAGCNRATGAGCTLIPITDTGQPVQFYPYFSTAGSRSHQDQSFGFGGQGGQGSQGGQGEHGGCVWQFGATPPGTRNDFGQNAGYGSLLFNSYLIFGGGGASHQLTNDFRNVFSSNPCPASNGDEQH